MKEIDIREYLLLDIELSEIEGGHLPNFDSLEDVLREMTGEMFDYDFSDLEQAISDFD